MRKTGLSTMVEGKYERIQRGMANWVAFYRQNPHRFALDYFGMTWLAPFQHVLLLLICNYTYLMIIASRGMGKSMMVAAAICIKCTLYPGIKITIAAGNRSQSNNVLQVIVDKYMVDSENLRNEIQEYKISSAEAYIKWKNGSVVRVVTARDSARSARTNWMIADEFVQIKKSILDKVLRKFKSGERTPGFFNNPKYKRYPKERNQETYISSAYYKWHYSWDKFKAFAKSMSRDEPYFVCGFPYQLPVSAGYYPAEQIREEMQEDDFDSIAFSMEMESLFYGESEHAFFSFADVNSVRKVPRPIYPRPYYAILSDSKFKYPLKQANEIRLIGMDVATAGGSRNDATAISVIQMLPSGTQYVRNVVYMETIDGGHGQDQAIRIRQLYDDFDADYVIVDTNGGNAPIHGDMNSVTRKIPETLKRESEWKVVFKKSITRNAYEMNLCNTEYNSRTSPRHL